MWYSDAYILVKGTMSVTGGLVAVGEAPKGLDERNKWVIFRNRAPFSDCIVIIIWKYLNVYGNIAEMSCMMLL